MSKKLYIAYGSNLNLKQMKYRCPTAKLGGKGYSRKLRIAVQGDASLFLCDNCTLRR